MPRLRCSPAVVVKFVTAFVSVMSRVSSIALGSPNRFGGFASWRSSQHTLSMISTCTFGAGAGLVRLYGLLSWSKWPIMALIRLWS